MAASKSSRTATGKKRKQITTGTTSASTDTGGGGTAAALARLKSIYGGMSGAGLSAPAASRPTYTAPKTTQPKIVPSGTTGVTDAISRGMTSTSGGSVNAASTGGGVNPAEVGVTGANDINQALTGKVGGYGIRPDAIPMLYQEPQALLRMTMQNMGLDPNQNQGMYNMALPNADLVNALSMIGLGGQKGYDAGENSQVLNFMDNLFRQGMTRGGQAIDFSAGMDNILGASKESPLATMMGMDDPRGQVAAVSSLMLPLAEAGLHPLFARSLQKSLQSLGDEYFQQYANAPKPPSNFQGFAGGRLGL